MNLYLSYAFLRNRLKLLLKARTLTFLCSLQELLKFYQCQDQYGKRSYGTSFVIKVTYFIILLLIVPCFSFAQDISSFKQNYAAHRGKKAENMAGIHEGSPKEASLAGSSSLEGAAVERLGSADPAVQFMKETIKPYFTIGEDDPLVKGAKEAIKDPETFLKAGTVVTEEIVEDEEAICEEGKGISRTVCIENPVVETIPPTQKEHLMRVHLSHTQNWSYGILYNVFEKKSLKREGASSPGVIAGEFPVEDISRIQDIRIVKVENKLDGTLAGGSRSLTVDKTTGLLWAETPYGSSYGRDVKWDSYIDLSILYEAPERQITVGKGCIHLKEKARKGLCKLVETKILDSSQENKQKENDLKWWGRRLTFECGSAHSSTCTPLKKRGCFQVGSVCKRKQEDTCVLWEQTYRCPSKKRKRTTRMESEFNLDKGKIGAPAPNTGMADAVAKLQILKEVQEDIREGESNALPSIFKGGSGKCTIAFGSFKNCCGKEKGWGTSLNLAGCTGDEKDLAQKRGKDLCVEIGTYCAEKLPLVGCTKKKKSYCCFPSKLSRLVHEQGRSQLGIGWGSPKSPNCRGFRVEELAHINFDKLDLSEMISDVAKRATSIDPGALQQRLGDRVQSMTSPFKEEGQGI